MQTVFAHKALLADGWADNARLSIRDGRIAAIETDSRIVDEDTVVGVAVPGVANAHSHAFQRALTGHTEERSAAGHDNFWTWRERMYELATHMNPDRLRAIASQAYVEMLERGYTAVAEFHYLHAAGDSSSGAQAMFGALKQAANAAGIRLAYVPVLYERAGFDDPAPGTSQRRFATTEG